MSNGERKAVGWTEHEIEEIAHREVSKVAPNPLGGGGVDMQNVWKWLAVTALTICLGVGVTAVVQSASAEECATSAKKLAETNAKEKISKERAEEKFAPAVTVEVIKSELDHIKLEQRKQAEKLDKILTAVQHRRR